MASCATCRKTILFGGRRDGALKYCDANCQARGNLARYVQQIPHDFLAQQTAAIFHGRCPKCQGPGPIDVHTSHRVWSFLLLTSWKSRPQISCRSCGRKRQALDALYSFFLGWWGIPWGLVMTPVQIGKNITGMFAGRSENEPSQELQQATGMIIASQMAQRQSSRSGTSAASAPTSS